MLPLLSGHLGRRMLPFLCAQDAFVSVGAGYCCHLGARPVFVSRSLMSAHTHAEDRAG
jgi:hypothetical protein